MLPSGKAQLVVALHQAPMICLPTLTSKNPIFWSRTMVHGPQWSYFVSGPKPRGAVAGVSFRPGGAGPVLGVPITELTDRHVALASLWGTRANATYERLLAAAEAASVFRILEQDLTARLRRPLIREFRDFAGITPSQYRPRGPDSVFHHRA